MLCSAYVLNAALGFRTTDTEGPEHLGLLLVLDNAYTRTPSKRTSPLSLQLVPTSRYWKFQVKKH